MTEISYQCDQCPLHFKMVESYDKHKLVHNLNRQYVCLLCMSVFGISKGLERHLQCHPDFQQEEEEESIHYGSLGEESNFEDFPEIPENEEVNSTGSCDSRASSATQPDEIESSDLIQSKNVGFLESSSETQPDENESSDLIQSKNVEFLECKICRKWFPNMWILTSHMQIHEKKEQFYCNKCDIIFAQIFHFKEHLRRSHASEPNPVCKVCGLTFNTPERIRKHTIDHQHMHKAFKCHLCQFVSNEKDVIKKHLKAAHSNTLSECKSCDMIFGNGLAKKNHMFSQHPFDEFYMSRLSCPFCPAKFGAKNNLTRHIRLKHDAKYSEDQEYPPRTKSKIDQHHDNLSILKLGSLYKLKHTNSLRVMRKSDLNRDLIHFEGQTIHPCYVPMPFVTEEEVVKACFQKSTKDQNVSNHRAEDQVENPNKRKAFLKALKNMEEDEVTEDVQNCQSFEVPHPLSATQRVSPTDMNSTEKCASIQPKMSDGISNEIPKRSNKLTIHKINGSYEIQIVKEEQDVEEEENKEFLSPAACLNSTEKQTPNRPNTKEVSSNKRSRLLSKSTILSEESCEPSEVPQTLSATQRMSPTNLNSTVNCSSTQRMTNDGSSKKIRDSLMSFGKAKIAKENYKFVIRHQLAEWPMKCPKCTGDIQDLRTFNIHMRRHWSCDTICPICDLSITRKMYFQGHLLKHSEKWTFGCKKCHKYFNTKYHVLRHLKTHSNVACSV